MSISITLIPILQMCPVGHKVISTQLVSSGSIQNSILAAWLPSLNSTLTPYNMGIFDTLEKEEGKIDDVDVD